MYPERHNIVTIVSVDGKNLVGDTFVLRVSLRHLPRTRGNVSTPLTSSRSNLSSGY